MWSSHGGSIDGDAFYTLCHYFKWSMHRCRGAHTANSRGGPSWLQFFLLVPKIVNPPPHIFFSIFIGNFSVNIFQTTNVNFFYALQIFRHFFVPNIYSISILKQFIAKCYCSRGGPNDTLAPPILPTGGGHGPLAPPLCAPLAGG